MKWVTRENVHIVYDALYAYCRQMVREGKAEGIAAGR